MRRLAYWLRAIGRGMVGVSALLVLLGLLNQCHAHGVVATSSTDVPRYALYCPANGGLCVGNNVFGDSAGMGNDRAAMCQAGYAQYVANNSGTNMVAIYDAADGTYGSCRGHHWSGQGSVGYISYFSINGTISVASCPANSSQVGSSCVCSAGFSPGVGGTSCQPIGSCDAVIGAAVSGWGANNYLPVSSMDVTQCYGGCEVRAAFVVKQDGVIYMAGPQATGAHCQGNGNTGTTATGEPFPQPVPPGKCPGTVNGQSVIVDCSESQTGTKSETLNPDASTVKTDSKTTCKAGQGCTTTTTTTSCTGAGSCSTSTTTTVGADSNAGGNGSNVGGGGGGGSGEDPCVANPDRAGCKGLGTASGDPIAGVNRTVSITPDSGWSHDSSCPADKVLNLAAVTLTVPFTLLCTAADYARPIVLAVAWLSAIGGFFGLARKGD